MNFATKLVISLIAISTTVVGSIWTGFEALDGRMDGKVEAGKKEVYHLLGEMKSDRDAALKAQDEKVSVQIAALHGEMIEMRKDVRSILYINRRLQQVELEKKGDLPYTSYKPTTKDGESL
jgi:hypothetical protein